MQSPNLIPPPDPRTRVIGVFAVIAILLLLPAVLAVWFWLWSVAAINWHGMTAAVSGATL